MWDPLVTVQSVILMQWAAAADDYRAAAIACRQAGRAFTPPTTGRPLRVIENRPPGTHKSTGASRTFGMWRWLTAPWDRGLHISFGLKQLGLRLHADRKLIADDARYRALAARCGFAIRSSNQSELTTSAGGALMVAETKKAAGAALGTHAHWHIIDDPLNRPDQRSPAARETVGRVLVGTYGSRFIDATVNATWLTMQRLGQGDPTDAMLAGYPPGAFVRLIIPRAYEPWRHALEPTHAWYIPEQLDLGEPVEAVSRALNGDVAWRGYRERLLRSGFWLEGGHLRWADWRTKEGEQIDPATPVTEADAKSAWAADHQQRVEGAEGSIVKRTWFTDAGFWRQLPAGDPDELIIAGDCQKAVKGAKKPDATALLVGARYGPILYLIEEIHTQAGLTLLEVILWRLYQRHGQPRSVVLEDAGAAGAARERLLRHGMPIQLVAAKTTGDSCRRLDDVSPLIRAGVVRLPAPNAQRPTWLAPGERWPATTIRTDDPQLPAALRAPDNAPPEAPIHVEASQVWVPLWLTEVCSVGGETNVPDDRSDALAYMLLALEHRLRAPAPQPAPAEPPPPMRATRVMPAGRLTRWSERGVSDS